MSKFGFWIIPENELYQELDDLIKKYSKEYGSPTFVPHMTIHGAVDTTSDQEVVEDVRQAVQDIKPFEINVGEVEFSTTFFQCVFARMKTSAPLLDTHLALRRNLGYKESHVFMPHASLVYGDFNMKTREKIASEIVLKETHFMASKITIVRADSNDPKDWEIVEQVNI